MREHIRAGGRACALEAGVNGQMITLYDRGGHIPLVWTHLIPATLEGRAMHNVQNAMFAAAMAFSLGIKLDAIRQGLRTFDTTFFQAPGRMNVFNEHPFKVLLDYGHNAHAVGVMADLAQRLDVTGRRIVVLAGPGDRRDEDSARDRECRGRPFRPLHLSSRRQPAQARRRRSAADHGEYARAAGVAKPRSRSFRTNRKRSTPRCRWVSAGDLLLIFADVLTRSWKQITKFKPAGAPETAARVAPVAAAPVLSEVSAEPPPFTSLEGLLRDERGIRLAPEVDD